ncbi:Hypothetical predicted protein [Octopus vulgaris]|uniref:Uncharacterized protein n=1 Tax=Octopus vulgaris TaxID=6645 RepID=A0AA36B727_OCTVU|nr:Hypothetical predicted protein [Octopus vulgaris]
MSTIAVAYEIYTFIKTALITVDRFVNHKRSCTGERLYHFEISGKSSVSNINVTKNKRLHTGQVYSTFYFS